MIKLVTYNHLWKLPKNQADSEDVTESAWFVRVHWHEYAGGTGPECLRNLRFTAHIRVFIDEIPSDRTT
jgi:hypothetical protein